jgi:hypothetical protein
MRRSKPIDPWKAADAEIARIYSRIGNGVQISNQLYE